MFNTVEKAAQKKVEETWIASHVVLSWKAPQTPECVKIQMQTLGSTFRMRVAVVFKCLLCGERKTMCAAWESLQKLCFVASLCLWLTFIIFKTTRIKAVLKIFKCFSVLKHMLVFWLLPVILFSVTTEGNSCRTTLSIFSKNLIK